MLMKTAPLDCVSQVAMSEVSRALPRLQSRGEEIANAVSHGAALLVAVIAIPGLIVTAVGRGDIGGIVGASVFATTVILLYFASTVYHALPNSQAKKVFQVLDHIAIFLLIAGTYTPFLFGVLRGAWGWLLFGLVWGMALVGVTLKVTKGVRYERFSLALYLLMGWSALIAIKPLWQRMPAWGLGWLAAGGAAYTLGVVFYKTDHVRYNHFVWHLFVITGTTCHYIAVFWYAG